ncbi:luc7-like protein 3 isoform X2 [Varroa destructor]|uniref:Uncharacterized protein n=1 Tax=Varroa destructor TaxID=109461 RepID=A0A7M7K272_VARDE|nr:luc7-like protein 3 isoform X2 [Varroa destructor]
MARSTDSDDYHRSCRRKRYRSSSSSSASSSSSSSDDSRERRRRRRSRSTSRRRNKSRDRSREKNRRSRSRSKRRSGSRDRRERSNKRDIKRRRTRSPRRRRSRSSSGSADSRKRDTRKRDDRREYIDTKECSRDAFVVELPTVQNEAERLRAIESINNAGFSQQNFLSKRSQQPTKADEGIGSAGDAHVSAMFGTTSLEEFLAAQAKKPPKLTDYKDTPDLLLHENVHFPDKFDQDVINQWLPSTLAKKTTYHPFAYCKASQVLL